MHPDRRQGQELLDELAAAYDDVPDVDRSLMFGSEALRVAPDSGARSSKVFAFVGREGELILKLPAPRVAELLAAGEAEPVHIGRNQTREWAAVPYPTDPTRWGDLLAEAHTFVSRGG
ncbi:hypothetical protein [Kribbella italica]|uniref:MmcQ/YjbR family DNA-binding protein n=1 Tax=Kribbella italica TaxID=1540520 RepID=A0A7W9J3H6_9ACTN|nr:hypothetical protein [Kribbella italica]MBB5834223.1 hypothetical protein [Kribbella italica]